MREGGVRSKRADRWGHAQGSGRAGGDNSPHDTKNGVQTRESHKGLKDAARTEEKKAARLKDPQARMSGGKQKPGKKISRKHNRPKGVPRKKNARCRRTYISAEVTGNCGGRLQDQR